MACQRAGIAVPEEVAVVGAENEETLCSFATPPLTSVRFDGQTVGYTAAEMLDQLMQGQTPLPREILIRPRGIVVRASSDELVINDPLVAQAARFIRENALAGLNVDDLCRKLNASRSTLDRRMKAALHRTPKEEITRIHIREVERHFSSPPHQQRDRGADRRVSTQIQSLTPPRPPFGRRSTRRSAWPSVRCLRSGRWSGWQRLWCGDREP